MVSSDVTSLAQLFADYAAGIGSYDEMSEGPGALRPHWRWFAAQSERLSRLELGRRWVQAQRLLRQSSLAYPDPHEFPAGHHPWQLDALPLVIPAAEWRDIAAALQQRARLLDAVLHDIYGSQQLITRGVLPADLIFRHPGYCLVYRALHTTGRMLHFYAADLARAPDGRWSVLADRCEAPSGAGFALENRIAISRMLPDVMHACRVERLAPFFLAMQRHLAGLAPPQATNPRILMLSRATGSANYFEDAFLARYLGYNLAEAGDLAVRGARIYLKSLSGLSPVDVLLRRPDSERCDPLELSANSPVGVAGLVQVLRNRQVAMANGLGSGLVESPVFMAYLPQVCRELLGEPLKMPSTDTWWCGDAAARQHVLRHLDELTIKPAFRRRVAEQADTLRLARMTPQQRRDLIASHPAGYVAQQRVVRSSVPIWCDGRLESSYLALRAFVIADGDDYLALPGGLARVSASLAPLELSLLDGEQSKDTWVLAEGPVPPVTLLAPPEQGLPLRRGGVELSSRAAEHFFWLGRHTIRAEILGKVLRALATRLTSEEDASRIRELPVLLRVLANRGQIEPGFVVDEIRPLLPSVEQALPLAVFDEAQVGTLRHTVSQIVSASLAVRDLISIDTWRIIRQMDLAFWPAADDEGLLSLLERIQSMLVQLAAFSGQLAESMTRTHGWRFLDCGRRLERVLQSTDLIQTFFTAPGGTDPFALAALLEICDASMTYRSRYLARMQRAPVLDLLMADVTNPGSIAFQLVECLTHVEQLAPMLGPPSKAPEIELAARLLHAVREADVQGIAQACDAGDDRPLEHLLRAIADAPPQLSDALAHKYFFHSGPAHLLAEIHPG